MNSLGGAFMVVLRRDLALAMRRQSQIINPLAFFVIVVSLFPLGLGPEPNLLKSMAPSVIWVAALLATMLSLENIFHGDFEDGTLEQLLMSPSPIFITVVAKVCAHWLLSGLPLLLVSPILAGAFFVPTDALVTLMWSLVLGTPTLSLIGAIGVALTVSLRRGGVLVSILVLPLYIPVLIFGAGAVDLAIGGIDASANLYILSSILVFAASLAPWAAAAALRISTE